MFRVFSRFGDKSKDRRAVSCSAVSVFKNHPPPPKNKNAELFFSILKILIKPLVRAKKSSLKINCLILILHLQLEVLSSELVVLLLFDVRSVVDPGTTEKVVVVVVVS